MDSNPALLSTRAKTDSLVILENKKFFELKRGGYRDGIKRKDKIGMGHESLHIMELISV